MNIPIKSHLQACNAIIASKQEVWLQKTKWDPFLRNIGLGDSELEQEIHESFFNTSNLLKNRHNI